jgi:hypothetical protein
MPTALVDMVWSVALFLVLAALYFYLRPRG